MKIHLFRHGLTVANEKRLYYGATDLPLSDNGVRELKQLKSTFRFPVAEYHITSGLQRAKESMQILFGKTPDVEIDELNEYNFGDFEMKTHDELQHEPNYIRWITGDVEFPCPSGESRNQFTNRVNRGLEFLLEILAKNTVKSAIVVSHGGVIAVLMDRLFPEPKKQYYEWVPECGRGYTVEIMEGKTIRYHAVIE